MRKIISLISLSLVFGLSLYASDGPQADLFLGYSFLRYNSAQTIPAFTANGGLATFGWNFNPHIGIEAELGGYHNGNVSGHEFDTTSFSYLFGPRFSLSRARRVDPYIHVLFGGQNAHTSICCVGVSQPLPGATPTTGTRVSASQNNFAMAAGGGLDIKLTRSILLRPIQLDYYLTRFEAPNLSNLNGPTSNRNQNDLRFAAGIAFNFGSAR
jgi:opacity protein-like surface antigen